MDWADDIAFSVHDVEDFYRAGLIPLDQLLLGTVERDRFIEAVFQRWEKGGRKDRLEVLDRVGATEFFDLLNFRTGIGDLEPAATGLNTSYVAARTQHVQLNTLATFLIRRYVVGSDDGKKAVTLVPPPAQPTLQIEPVFRTEVELLKALMWYYVYDSPALVAQQYGHKRVIQDLFRIYFEAVRPTSKDVSLLPLPFRERWKTIKSEKVERARLVVDLITSMTEQQALLIHQRLTGSVPGSVRDPIIS